MAAYKQSNHDILVIVAILLIISSILTTFAIINGSDVIRDGWFLPILLAEIWTICIGLGNKLY